MERAGVPLIRNLAMAKSNDCVMMIGTRGTAIRSAHALSSILPKAISPWLMNEVARSVSALEPAELERRLRREGLPARIGESDWNSTPISVTVWGYEAVEMRRSFPTLHKVNGVKYKAGLWRERMFIASDHAIWKPAEKMAIRSLYLLGLDFGQVELLLNSKGKLSVTGISHEMDLQSKEGERKLKAKLQEFSATWASETSLGVQAKLGADPEFVLMSTEGRIIPASRYFLPEGDAGCDSVRIRGEKRWPLVELRPKPFMEPIQLTADVRRLLHVAAHRTEGASLSWRAGALPVPGLPLGGHIHLSGVALIGERLRALDNAVALPLRMLEPFAAARRRPRYGSLGDVRRQSHGGFEYRTPPSWLVSPRLTLAAFALAKVAAEHSRELSADRPLDSDDCRDAFYEGDRTSLLPAVERVYAAISATEAYQVYREPIDFVFDAIRRNRSWDESTDFRVKWRIPIS